VAFGRVVRCGRRVAVTYPGSITPATVRKRFGRIIPYLVINTGMLPAPIQLLRRGALRSPAQRVRARTQGRVHHHESRGVGAEVREVLQRQGPLALRLAEAFFVVYQLGWVVLFATSGLVWCAISAAYVASCLVYLGFFYGDHAGKVCFAFHRSRLRFPTRARPSLGLAPPERS